MNEQPGNNDLDKELEDLELFQPSMRFSKNVVEQVKLNTTLIKPERGPLYWLPRIFVASALTVFVLITVLLLLRQSTFSEAVISQQMSQATMAVFGSLAGLALLLVMDRLFRKLILH